MSIWASISEAVKAGEDPVVYLSMDMLSSLVNPAAKKKRGRPPKPKATSYALHSKRPHELRKTEYKTKYRVYRCWNPHCRKRCIEKHVCNEHCKVLAVEHFETAIAILNQERPTEVQDVPNVQLYDEGGAVSQRAGTAPAEKIRDPRGRKPKGFRKTQSSPRDGQGKSISDLFRRARDGSTKPG